MDGECIKEKPESQEEVHDEAEEGLQASALEVGVSLCWQKVQVSVKCARYMPMEMAPCRSSQLKSPVVCGIRVEYRLAH